MGELRKLASQGLPDAAGIRATVWKVLIMILIIALIFDCFCDVIIY